MGTIIHLYSTCEINKADEEVIDYIVQDIPGIEEEIIKLPNVCSERVDANWILAYGPLSEDRQLNISSLGYFTIPKLYGLMEDSSIDLSVIEEIGATKVLELKNLSADGKGVLLGFIDTGIDYTKDVFRDEIGNSIIETIWDQTTDSVYEKKDIDNALKAMSQGNDPLEIVPEVDEIGHGTMLSSIRIAPKANIAMVKLKPAKRYLREFFFVKDGVPAYEENDIMRGVKFLKDKANKLRKPLVLILGLGAANGSRTGSSPLADMLNNLTMQPGISVITCMGNEANARTHYRGNVTSALVPDVVEVNVSKPGKGFFLELWAESLDILSVSIESPSGEYVPRIPARMGASMQYQFLYEGSRVSVDYQIAENVTGMEVIFISLKDPTPGVWKIYVYSLTNIKGTYNAWLPIKEFMDQEIFFLKPDPDITMTGPAAASRVISVGAYNHYTDSNYLDSGRGFTADGRVKPDIIAPGVNIYAIKPIGPVRVSGTSLAAVITAGVVALMFSYALNRGEDELLSHSDVKAALIRGAVRDGGREYPNSTQGYGRLNVLGAFEQLRRI